MTYITLFANHYYVFANHSLVAKIILEPMKPIFNLTKLEFAADRVNHIHKNLQIDLVSGFISKRIYPVVIIRILQQATTEPHFE